MILCRQDLLTSKFIRLYRETIWKCISDNDLSLPIWIYFDLVKTTRNWLWTEILAPQAINLFFIACFFIIHMCKVFLFSTCILPSYFELLSPKVHTHAFFDFLLTSHHDFFHSTCQLIFDKIYLCHLTCIDILIRYLPVYCNRLITKYLGSRNTYWKTCHFNIGVIDVDFSLYYSLSIKYLKCAIKYLMNFLHLSNRPCAYDLLLLNIVKLTRLIVYFTTIILIEILKFSRLFLAYLICNLRIRPCNILDTIRIRPRYIFNLQVLSFQKLKLYKLRFRPSTFFVLIGFRPFLIFALWAFRPFAARIFDFSIYFSTYRLCNLGVRPFCIFALGTFRYLFNFFYFSKLIFNPNYKESYS